MGRYRVLLLLLLINIFNYIDRNALAGVSPLLKSSFHLTDATIGALGSAFLLSYTLVAVPFGIWSDCMEAAKDCSDRCPYLERRECHDEHIDH